MIYFECNADRALLASLDVPMEQAVHSDGIGGVCKALEVSCGNIGLIDEDPRGSLPNYLDELEQLDERHKMVLKQDAGRNHGVIVLCPALEAWVLHAAKNAGVDVREFGLPDDKVKLWKKIDLQQKDFRRLLTTLLPVSQELQALRRLINVGPWWNDKDGKWWG